MTWCHNDDENTQAYVYYDDGPYINIDRDMSINKHMYTMMMAPTLT